MGPNAEEERQVEEGHHGLVCDLETKLKVPQPVHLLKQSATSLLILNIYTMMMWQQSFALIPTF